jgi:hypothetical protein
VPGLRLRVLLGGDNRGGRFRPVTNDLLDMLDAIEEDFLKWKTKAIENMDRLRLANMEYEKWCQLYIESENALKRIKELRKA